MPDIIKLLPDSVANQIAAGEIIQRPSSAVKELMENAVDSGANNIKLIVKDAGKTLIQVIDNGCGMSATDARMAFEKHATSKIQSADDLFAIRTLGFRGEALASIAAIAQIELKTKKIEDELGSHLIIEGSEVKEQDVIQTANGTSIFVKNLFFNVPARRNFLKTDQVETRHIIEEFIRVAMVNPNNAFSFHHNDKALFQLLGSNLKQRIIGLFGNQFSQRLVPVEQATKNVNIYGFIGKPEFARKTRGEQYFFANNRFIKHPYLHHSINAAFQELLPNDTYPTYFLFIEVDPKTIDINIHPTKTEINFQDGKLIYAVLRAAVRQALGKYNLTPSLDFDVDQAFNFPEAPKNKPIQAPTITIDPEYNPFDTKSKNFNTSFKSKKDVSNWESLFIDKQGTNDGVEKSQLVEQENNDLENSKLDLGNKLLNQKIFQLKDKYIITIISSGIMLIDQNRAHERILYEKYMQLLKNDTQDSQQELFPVTISFTPAEIEIIKDIEDELILLGFQMEKLGKTSMVFTGRPADLEDKNISVSIERIIENYQKNLLDLNQNKKTNLAQAMAASLAVKSGQSLQKEEQNALVDQLFACRITDLSPNGKIVFKIIALNDVEKMFN
jgi:DNA mismatch repair protein MutL